MEFLAKWLLLTGITTAATLSPGPAFAVSVRNALAYNRRAGLLTALGLGAGVGAHALFALCGIALIIAQSVMIFNAIKYAGAAYLIFIGVQSLRKRAKPADSNNTAKSAQSIPPVKTQEASKNISDAKAFKIGFLTNILNPKTVIFFTAIFTQFITPDTSHSVMALYLLTCTAIETIWFSAVSTLLTNSAIKARFTKIAHWVERICGGLLIALGVKLALSKA